MLLQIDGSPHAWFGPPPARRTLFGAIDDAISAVVAAVFRTQEDAKGSLLLLRIDQIRHDSHNRPAYGTSNLRHTHRSMFQLVRRTSA